MRYLLFLLFVFFVPIKAHAYYFLYQVDEHILKPNVEYVIRFEFDIRGINTTDFKVRPVMSNAVVLVYQPKTDSWVFATQPWELLPALNDKLKFKVLTFTSTSGLLYFELLNTKNNELMKTQTDRIWFYSIYNEYLSKLNARINK